MCVYCIIPAYNEEKNIKQVIDEVRFLVDKIVVVDDGSSDNTCGLAEAAGVIVLKHLVNRGQGAALRTGTRYAIKAGGEVIVHFDADGQFSAADIEKIVCPILKKQVDVVFGSRFLNRDKYPQGMPLLKYYLIMPLARIINKLLLNINLTDPQSGFRALSLHSAEVISWSQDRMAHCSEILYQIKKNNLRFTEEPITVIYREYGQRFSGGLKILKDLFLGALTK